MSISKTTILYHIVFIFLQSPLSNGAKYTGCPSPLQIVSLHPNPPADPLYDKVHLTHDKWFHSYHSARSGAHIHFPFQPKDPIRVCITGAAGQIAYSLLYSVAKGDVFGKDQVGKTISFSNFNDKC